MFQKIVQTYPFQAQQKQKQTWVKQILSNSPFDGSSVLKQINQIYDKLIPILTEHPQIIVQFIFQHLAIQDCLRLIEIQSNEFQKDSKEEQFKKQQNGFLRILNDVGKSVANQKDNGYIEWFSKMYSKYSSIERLLIFLRELSFNYQQKYTDQYFPEFIADFIKSSALCIECYLKIKSQAPKFDIDYIQHGQKLVKYTQTWVKIFYLNLIKNLRIPQSNSKLKNSMLNGVCDIIGALMQVQRQGNIDYNVCNQILSECYSYLKKITSIQQFNNTYLKYLQQNHFNVAHKKITLPNFYPSHIVTFPKPSYCYVMYSFIQQSFYLYSKDKLFSLLVPLLNQLTPFQFSLKLQVEKWVMQICSQIQIKKFFSGKFPLAILWFNLWNNLSKGNQKIFKQINNLFEKVKLHDPQYYLNNLQLLTNFQFQDSQKALNEFIGDKALHLSTLIPQKLLILVKKMRWQNTNQKGQERWKQLFSNISKKQVSKKMFVQYYNKKSNKAKFQEVLLGTLIQ